MTEAAAKRIAKIVAGDPGKTALRVSVEGGGCSGFSYKFDLVDCATTTTSPSKRTARRC
jgi:Fe-S cluster assembly iron-binding protein IscA